MRHLSVGARFHAFCSDISLLARYLCPEEEAQDENVRWTWDYIFASVSSEMREEWAMEEEAEDGIGDSVNHR